MTNEIDWRLKENQENCLAGIEEGVAALRGQCAQLDESTFVSSVGLLQAARHSYRNLQTGWRECDLPLLAWATRNSVEGMIWTKFVTLSEANARRFYLDWLNDVEDSLRRAIQLDQNEGTDLRGGGAYTDVDFDPCAPAKAQAYIAELRQKYQSPSQRRLDIAKVAKEIGEDAAFTGLNPILSKLVHTTAYSILSFPSDSARIRQAAFMLDRGFWSLISVVGTVDAFLKGRNLIPILK
jgi:hypothetical protein